MPLQAHIDMLHTKHGKLESLIAEELLHPMPDLGALQQWKKQKLLLKEEMARLELLAMRERLDAA